MVTIVVPQKYRALPPEAFTKDLAQELLTGAFDWVGCTFPSMKGLARANKDGFGAAFWLDALNGYLPAEEGMVECLSAAEAGDVSAMLRVGCYYLHRHESGRPKLAKVFYWLERAADEGDCWAQATLALLCCVGEETPWTDYSAAYMWAWIAASGGDSIGKELLGQLQGQLSEEVVLDGKARAKEWFGRSKQA